MPGDSCRATALPSSPFRDLSIEDTTPFLHVAIASILNVLDFEAFSRLRARFYGTTSPAYAEFLNNANPYSQSLSKVTTNHDGGLTHL